MNPPNSPNPLDPGAGWAFTPETFELSLEKQFKIAVTMNVSEAAPVEDIRQELVDQMRTMMYLDNAIRLLMKGDRKSCPFTLSTEQLFEHRRYVDAAPNLSREQALNLLRDALRQTQIKSQVMHSFGAMFPEVNPAP